MRAFDTFAMVASDLILRDLSSSCPSVLARSLSLLFRHFQMGRGLVLRATLLFVREFLGNSLFHVRRGSGLGPPFCRVGAVRRSIHGVPCQVGWPSVIGSRGTTLYGNVERRGGWWLAFLYYPRIGVLLLHILFRSSLLLPLLIPIIVLLAQRIVVGADCVQNREFQFGMTSHRHDAG